MFEILKIVTFFALLLGAIKFVRWVLGVDETHRLLSEISRKLGADPEPPRPGVLSRLRGRFGVPSVLRGSSRASAAAVAALAESGRTNNGSVEK